MVKVWHTAEPLEPPQYGENIFPGLGTMHPDSRPTSSQASISSSGTHDHQITPVGSPPSYESAVAMPTSRHIRRRDGPVPVTSTQYSKNLVKMQKDLKKRAKRGDDTRSRLAGVRDLDGIHEIIASSLLKMLSVLPESEVDADESAAEILARYHMDSMSSMRIATWARQNFGLQLSTKDLVTAEVQTLDGAAFLVASRYMDSSA